MLKKNNNTHNVVLVVFTHKYTLYVVRIKPKVSKYLSSSKFGCLFLIQKSIKYDTVSLKVQTCILFSIKHKKKFLQLG